MTEPAPQCEMCLDLERVLIAEPGSMDAVPVLCPACQWGLPIVVVGGES